MLQTRKSSSVPDVPVPATEDAGLADTASLAVGIVRRHYLMILFATFVATGIGATYLLITPPTYTAKAQIIIDRGKSPLFQQQGVFPDVPIDAAQIESQTQILASERIAASVVKSLHLTEDPAFVAVGVADSLRRKLGNFVRTLDSNVFSSSELATSDSGLVRRATATLLRDLQVNRVGISFSIEINYRSHSAERAAQVANAIAEAYIVDQMDAKYETQRRTSGWLQSRVNQLRQQATASEDAINAYKTANNMVAAGGTLIKEQEIAELNKQLVIAREKTAESLARLNRIESVLSRQDIGGASVDRGRSDPLVDGTVSDVFSNPIITRLRQQYLELVN